MIGQTQNRNIIKSWSIDNNAPQFIIISGEKGSGKKTIAHYLADTLNKTYISVDTSVDSIRTMIQQAYKFEGVYVVEDADTMSNNAKNALLKIVEEPPKDTYFILTVSSEANVLDTLKSRAYRVKMEIYTQEELMQYKDYFPQIYYDIADNFYQLDILEEYGYEFIEYINLVIDNVREVEPANAFKSGIKLALKTESGYDLELFFKAIIRVLMSRPIACDAKTITGLHMIPITLEYLSRLSKLGVNKQQLYDMWVMDVRAV